MHKVAQNKKEYKEHIDQALSDDYMHKTLDKFAVEYKISRDTAISSVSFKECVQTIANTKDYCAQHLEELYEQFKFEAQKRNVIVHRANDAYEANAHIAEICKKRGGKRIIKSKSMTAEESELNKYLYEESGIEDIEITETDLGEWIIQLRNEGPSHMVMPAIHLSRYQIAEDFSNITKENYDPEDVQKLVKVARVQLRKKFNQADIGISGANFCIAENGSFALVTNEGNAKMVATLPRTHIVLAGLDKLVPDIEAALTAATVLPRNATAQNLTANLTFINGLTDHNFLQDGEQEKELHVIFLDNGRTELAKDPLFSQIFRCVRCGACANVCPVYRMVGGHRMGYIYIGAIGLILTYFFHNKEKANYLSQNCIACEACKDICAGNIDLPALIREIRNRCQEDFGRPAIGMFASQLLKNRKVFHSFLKAARFSQKPLVDEERYLRHLPDFLLGKHQFKALPTLAPKAFRELWKEKLAYVLPNPHKHVAIFAGCVQDFVYPHHLEALVKIMKAKNIQLHFPEEQNCCGLPLQMLSEKTIAKEIAKTNLRAFSMAYYDAIVTLCASCASHLKHGYSELIGENTYNFSSKIYDFSSFMTDFIQINKDDFNKSNEKVALHLPCHQCRALKVKQQPRNLIHFVADYTQSKEEEVCCGFGGTYSAKFPEISAKILENKLQRIKESGATRVVMDCPGCIMQINGGAHKAQEKIKVTHIAELLAENLQKTF